MTVRSILFQSLDEFVFVNCIVNCIVLYCIVLYCIVLYCIGCTILIIAPVTNDLPPTPVCRLNTSSVRINCIQYNNNVYNLKKINQKFIVIRWNETNHNFHTCTVLIHLLWSTILQSNCQRASYGIKDGMLQVDLRSI